MFFILQNNQPTNINYKDVEDGQIEWEENNKQPIKYGRKIQRRKQLYPEVRVENE